MKPPLVYRHLVATLVRPLSDKEVTGAGFRGLPLTRHGLVPHLTEEGKLTLQWKLWLARARHKLRPVCTCGQHRQCSTPVDHSAKREDFTDGQRARIPSTPMDATGPKMDRHRQWLKGTASGRAIALRSSSGKVSITNQTILSLGIGLGSDMRIDSNQWPTAEDNHR